MKFILVIIFLAGDFNAGIALPEKFDKKFECERYFMNNFVKGVDHVCVVAP